MPHSEFDPHAKEQALVADAQAWDTSSVSQAHTDDIPTVDISAIDNDRGLLHAAEQLGHACRQVGFFYLTGHGVAQATIELALQEAARFHALEPAIKAPLAMDQPEHPPGIGYLGVGHRKLPRRVQGNRNAAFILKRDQALGLANNLWPAEAALPGFRHNMYRLADTLEEQSRRLLPVFARALDIPDDYFTPAFKDPLYRLRLTEYPAEQKDDTFGIAPHVDTTFFTLLITVTPGLVVYHAGRDLWLEVPPRPSSLIVNTGELLKQWSNDEFISVRHFVRNLTGQRRYAVPFFFNATSDYPMTCIPSCCGPDRPPRYPPMSYRESQGVVQGE